MDQSDKNSELESKFELKTVLETSRILVESRNSEFIINNLLLILMGRLLVPRAAIFIYDSRTNSYTLKKSKGLPKLEEEKQYKILGKEECKEVAYFKAEKADASIKKLLVDVGNSLFFNLRTNNNHHGILFLGGKANKEAFQEHELEFIEGLCIISTAALVNSQLFTELTNTYRNLDRRIHELNTLFDLSKEFNLLVDREKISRIFKFALLGQLFIRTFFLIYKNQDEISLLTSSGLKKQPDPSQIEHIFKTTEDDVIEVDERFANDYPWIYENNIAALISISVQNEKVAIIGVGERANKVPYTETDFNFLKSLANLAVISIQKTYFLEERIDKERMEEELSIAKSIQEGLLPDPIPEVNGVDLAARTISSREVGGDYFDVARTPDGNTILAIADVTGKGVPAALLMANLQSMLHVLLPVDITLSEATERINNLIYKNTPSDKFITFFWGKYLSTHKILRYVNAGHNPPLLLRKNSDRFDELSEGGLLLGAMESMAPYEQADVQLNPNDLLISYTDGVNEAMNNDEEEFGTTRLKKCILKNRDKSSEEILDAIVQEVLAFSNQKLFDDLTLLIIRAKELSD
ncbi:MAG: SpoIIE family protein phosphatase [Balneolaceae bacterium]|nr:SpoIIE family protein phosphatase [Balneolaceae bacterium]MDR9409702.1 SpoIIE family protein phosphatase [Balneolaceae bacterium]